MVVSEKWKTGLRIVAALVAAAVGVAASSSARRKAPAFTATPSRVSGLPMMDASWIYEVTTDPRQFKVNDQVTVVVSENSAVHSQGTVNQQKQISMTAVLTNWILFNGASVTPDPQSGGSPTIGGNYQNQYQSKADLQAADTMTFKIACRIVDRRPNGLLVIEGRRTIESNTEVWEQGVSGIVRPQDVLPNNQVLSENVAELKITKREAGQVRDGYRRGWFMKILDKYQLF